ncbi:MAG TPA: sensor histidine kinase [Hyphomonadaceae bacterium]|nr:sensor histidine kinase [Hyphomonadaceae bacterium]
MALSPVLVIGGVRWSGDIERETARRRETMLLVAEGAADRAQLVLSSAPGMLDVIGTLLQSDPCSKQLSEIMSKLPQYSAIGVIDANGSVECTTQEGGKGVSTSDRPWFHELKNSNLNFVQSTAYYGPVSKTWILASAKRRSNADGSFAGAFVLGTPVSSLVQSLDRTGLPTDSEIAIMDSTGLVFGSKNWAQIDQSTLGTLQTQGRGYFSLPNDKGEDRDVAIVSLAPGPFFAVLSAPKLAPIALENVSAFGNFALPLLAWLLALVTAWLATDRLVLRWLDYLRRIAGLYASGKLSVQPIRAKRAAPGEINVLADTLEEMAVRIRDRTARLESAVTARDAAMKEIHHRVKNNLQIINSLLSLQSRKVKDPAAVAVLDDARARINALSLIHRSLYEHNDIRSVDVKSFFSELATHLDQALGAEDQRIKIESDIDRDTIDADMAVPLALFTAEAVTNAVKHAFPAGRGVKGGRVLVSYKVGGKDTLLTVEDDGIGGPEADAAVGSGIGGTLMGAFAKQVHGVLEEEKLPGGGRRVRIRIPAKPDHPPAPAAIVSQSPAK